METGTDLWIVSNGPQRTRQIGVSLGGLARPGDLVLLVGDLGTGKTCLAQGIAQGLGFSGYVTSPSFVLVRDYQARLDMHHVDLYRLDSPQEIAELGLDDLLSQSGVCVIEWAEKAMALLPKERLLITLEHLSRHERRLHFQPQGLRYVQLLEELRQQWNWS